MNHDPSPLDGATESRDSTTVPLDTPPVPDLKALEVVFNTAQSWNEARAELARLSASTDSKRLQSHLLSLLLVVEEICAASLEAARSVPSATRTHMTRQADARRLAYAHLALRSASVAARLAAAAGYLGRTEGEQ